MARILALDYGRKRVGVAVSDPTGLIAGGLTTVPTASLMEFLNDYFQREEVERMVIGLPKQVNGQPSESMRYIQPFVGAARKKWPELPIEFYDERFTSVLAHQAMLAGGMKKKDRQNKAVVDKIAACIILEGYLDSLQ